MAWEISEKAPDNEKLKAEFADFIHGINSSGQITCATYCELFDFTMPLFDKMYELGTQTTQ